MKRKPSDEKIKEIHAAADALVLEGLDSPTNDDVRAKSGGGSIADISYAMRIWRENRKKEDQQAIELPSEVQAAGLRFVAKIYAQLSGDAAKKIDEVKQAAEKRTTELESELNQCLASLSELEESLRKSKDENEALTSKLDQTVSDLRNIEQIAHKHELEKEKALTKLESAQENEKSLKEQLAALQKELFTVARSATKSKN